MLKPYVTSESSEFFDLDRFYRIASIAPCLQASFERAHTGDAVAEEREGRTGTRGFVWSRAVQHYFPF